MKTYQDLKLQATSREVMQFLLEAIRDHKASQAYKTAVEAMAYYNGENPTIAKYEKLLYDLQGRAHRDLYTANHKIYSTFFQIAVDQENMYLLGNGVSFQDSRTGQSLGPDFDEMLQLAGEYALIGGVSFGFWNYDHLEVFHLAEFVPLYDEETGALMAGIRFFQIDANRPLRVTLYEPDGYTSFIQRDQDLEILEEKRPYILHLRETEGQSEVFAGENYPTFPIVPLRNGHGGRSELSGRRNTIDALDLVTSNMVNNVDEGNLIYWVLTGCGGMDDLDDAKFIERLKTTHVAHADGDDGGKVEAHTIAAPFEGTAAAIETLTRRLYTDFRAFDPGSITAGNQTATAIRASYVPLDLKTDKFERQVTLFLREILRLAGLEDQPTYTRNRVINVQEETETVLLGADYFDEQYITRKLLAILGDTDLAEEILERRKARP